jgi:hypothetical protein
MHILKSIPVLSMSVQTSSALVYKVGLPGDSPPLPDTQLESLSLFPKCSNVHYVDTLLFELPVDIKKETSVLDECSDWCLTFTQGTLLFVPSFKSQSYRRTPHDCE